MIELVAGVWGVCPPVKIVKMVRMVWACGWGVGCVCTPSGNGEYGENSENCLGLWLGRGVCTTVKMVKIWFELVTVV